MKIVGVTMWGSQPTRCAFVQCNCNTPQRNARKNREAIFPHGFGRSTIYRRRAVRMDCSSSMDHVGIATHDLQIANLAFSREARLHTSKKLQQKTLSFAFHHIHIFIRPRQILKIIIRKLFFCSALRCNNHKNSVCRRPS